MRRYSIVIIGMVIILAGCSQALQHDLDRNVATILPDEQPLGIDATLEAVLDITLTPAEEALEMDTNPQTLASVDPGLEPLITVAINDLAERLDIAPAEITLVSAEAVVWPDASLGCPQLDMLYQQVQVDGALIVLRVADRDYAYHSGGGREPFLCEQDEPKKYPQIKPTKGIYHPP